jgi:hypothetical protein
MQQMKVVAAAQRAGLIDRRSCSAEKPRRRREILAGPVTDLAEVSRRAPPDAPELGQMLR